MPTRLRSLGVLLAVALVFLSCGDDDDPTVVTPDTTPPVVSNVVAVDENHIDVTFSENVDRESAEKSDNYTIVETARRVTSAAPDDTLNVVAVVLKENGRTASITTAAMNVAPYNLAVAGVEDASGNAIGAAAVTSFTGTADADVTPPEIAYRSPAPNASGVSTNAPIVIVFSEFVSFASVVPGFSLTSSAGFIECTLTTSDYLRIYVVPAEPLQPGSPHTVRLEGVLDDAGNTMPVTTWGFQTAGPYDQTPPTIVASTPADLAVNVDVNTEISFTFSERMVETEGLALDMSPYIDLNLGEWSNSGKTWSTELLTPLEDDRQYTISIAPAYHHDLAGNELAAVAIHFTTGNQLERGGIAGRVTADDQSDYGSDLTGTFVVAEGEMLETEGWDLASLNGAYDIRYLPDDDYFVFAVLESNGDPDNLDPFFGDTFGIFGLDIRHGDYDEELLTVSGGARLTGRNFPLIDLSAVTGSVFYSGIYEGEFHDIEVGLFETASFDPEMPDYTVYADPGFYFLSYFDMPAEGTFFLGAYVDANDNFAYDAGIDPVGFYGDETLIELEIKNGSDFNGILLFVQDPSPGAKTATSTSAWPVRKNPRREVLERVSKAVESRVPRGQ